jgi:hypothetical protein
MHPVVAPSRSSQTRSVFARFRLRFSGNGILTESHQVDGLPYIFAFCGTGGSEKRADKQAGEHKMLSWLGHLGLAGSQEEGRTVGSPRDPRQSPRSPTASEEVGALLRRALLLLLRGDHQDVGVRE